MFETWYAMSAMLSSNPRAAPQHLRRRHRQTVRSRLGKGLRNCPQRNRRQSGPRLDRTVTGTHCQRIPPKDFRSTMYSAIKDQLQGELEEIRSAGLFKTERHIDSPAGQPHRSGPARRAGQQGPELLRQQLPGPGRPPGHHRRRQVSDGRARLRYGVRALHLRNPGPSPGA